MSHAAVIDVVVNCPSREVASDIAESLLDAHLIAASNCHRIESQYVWLGVKTLSEEWQLSCRTVEEHFDKISLLVTEIHPYVQPSIVARRIDLITDSYRKWVTAAVS